MATVSLEVPEDAMHAVAGTSDGFAAAVRLAAAMFWYGRGDLTMGTAAVIAGLSQAQFMRALKEAGQPTSDEDLDALDAELTFLAQRRQSGNTGG